MNPEDEHETTDIKWIELSNRPIFTAEQLDMMAH